MRHTLLHPFGVAFLALSFLIAGLLFFVPSPWAEQAPWFALIGILAYTASAAVLHGWKRPEENEHTVTEQPSISVNDHTETSDNGHAKSPGEFRSCVDKALKQLNKTATLARCELVDLVPYSLAAVAPQVKDDGTQREMTTLEKGQALHLVLRAAIERLKLPGDAIESRSSSAVHYHILHEQYVQGKPVAYIETRYEIPDGKYFKDRHKAVTAVSDDLQSQEALLAQIQEE